MNIADEVDQHNGTLLQPSRPRSIVAHCCNLGEPDRNKEPIGLSKSSRSFFKKRELMPFIGSLLTIFVRPYDGSSIYLLRLVLFRPQDKPD